MVIDGYEVINVRVVRFDLFTLAVLLLAASFISSDCAFLMPSAT